MTDTVVTEQKPAKVRVKVEPAPGSRLETLLTELRIASGRLDEVKGRFEELHGAVKAELQALRDASSQPDAYDVPAHPKGAYPAASLTYTPPSWQLDGKALKDADPKTWVQYARERRGFWTFKSR